GEELAGLDFLDAVAGEVDRVGGLLDAGLVAVEFVEGDEAEGGGVELTGGPGAGEDDEHAFEFEEEVLEGFLGFSEEAVGEGGVGLEEALKADADLLGLLRRV